MEDAKGVRTVCSPLFLAASPLWLQMCERNGKASRIGEAWFLLLLRKSPPIHLTATSMAHHHHGYIQQVPISSSNWGAGQMASGAW